MGEADVAVTESLDFFGHQEQLDTVVDDEDLGMMICLFGEQGDAADKTPGFGERVEVIAFPDGVAIRHLDPSMKFVHRRLPPAPPHSLHPPSLPPFACPPTP